jgi:periplasmic protein TonB
MIRNSLVNNNLDHVKPLKVKDAAKVYDVNLCHKLSVFLSGLDTSKSYFSKFSLSLIASIFFHSLALGAFLAPVILFAAMSELPAIQVEILAEIAEASEEKVSQVLPIPLIEEQKVEEQQSTESAQPIQNPIQLVSAPNKPTEEIIRPAEIKIEQKKALKIDRPKINRKLPPPEIESKKPSLADIRSEKQKRVAQIERNELADERHEKARDKRLAARKLASSKRAEQNQDKLDKQEKLDKPERENVMSQSAYASLVSAQINANKVYPSLAREQGISGVVNIAFTISRAGRVQNAIVTRSSGSAVLDTSAKQAVLAIALPPPPEGRFSSSVPIRFGLR